MRRVTFLFPLLLCLMIMSCPAVAQEDGGGTPDDLLNALAVIPDIPEAREWVSYVDFSGMEQARPGAQRPDTLQDFLDGEDSLGVTLWWFAIQGIYNGPVNLLQSFQMLGNMSEVIGMDFTEINQAVEWGQIPQSGVVLLGDFDTDSIAAAHTNRDYSASDLNGLTVWCHDGVGCEGGMETDFENRNTENPFGGQFGQNRPMLILENGVLSAGDYGLVEATSEIQSSDAQSLAESPEYRAIVEALDDSFVTIQALILPPDDVISAVDPFRMLPADAVEAIYDRLAATALSEPIPAYQLLAIVDQAAVTSQEVQVMLVYDSEADAQTAAEVLLNRINDYESLQTRQAFTDMLEDREASFTTSVYTSEETGKSVAMVSFTAPLAATLPIGGRYEVSSTVNRLLIQMVISRDTAWLSTGLPPLEDIQDAMDE